MPKAKSVSLKKETPASTEEPLLIPPNEVPADEKATFWLNLANDVALLRDHVCTIPFFQLVNDLPPALWERHMFIYLYRLDPEVRNRTGEKKYIEKITWPTDEESIKSKHGGGKYQLYLKCGDESIKEIIFSIDGPPKFLAGQTVVGQEAQPLAPGQAPPRSDLAEAIEATSKASNAGIEIMQKGMEGAINLQKQVLEKNAGLNEPKSSQLDELAKLVTVLKALMPTPPAPPAENPLVTKLLEAAITSFTAKPESAPSAPSEPLNVQLENVKNLLGVDSLREVFQKMNPRSARDETPSWIPSLLSFGQSLLEKAPELLQRMGENQELAFQRAIYAYQMQHAGALPPGAIQPPVITRAAPPQAPPPSVIPGTEPPSQWPS